MVNCLLSVYGPNGGCAYDIGCAFNKTANMSTIGSRIWVLRLRFMVGAFHRHAHNRLCQLDWHPTYIEGAGNTEGEGCEHVFSVSNELAQSMWHATWFHHHQAIEEHFAFWNEDKYEALSTYPSHQFILIDNSISAFYSEPLLRSSGFSPPTWYWTYRSQDCPEPYWWRLPSIHCRGVRVSQLPQASTATRHSKNPLCASPWWPWRKKVRIILIIWYVNQRLHL